MASRLRGRRLADTGMTVAREDLALEAAFWAQLPGNFPMRPRKAPITSRNFAAMVPFHNYPAGRATGNHWGDALTVLVTSARSPFHFSLHASDPTDPDGGSRKDTGTHPHLRTDRIRARPSSSGSWSRMLSAAGRTQVLFDKDRGLEILVRAMGGEYCPLKNGEPTGFNPLKLPPTPLNMEFLKRWLRVLVRPAVGALSVRQQADLDQALRGTLALELSARRLSRLARVPRFDRRRRPLRAACTLVRVRPGRLRLGLRQCAKTSIVPRLVGSTPWSGST